MNLIRIERPPRGSTHSKIPAPICFQKAVDFEIDAIKRLLELGAAPIHTESHSPSLKAIEDAQRFYTWCSALLLWKRNESFNLEAFLSSDPALEMFGWTRAYLQNLTTIMLTSPIDHLQWENIKALTRMGLRVKALKSIDVNDFSDIPSPVLFEHMRHNSLVAAESSNIVSFHQRNRRALGYAVEGCYCEDCLDTSGLSGIISIKSVAMASENDPTEKEPESPEVEAEFREVYLEDQFEGSSPALVEVKDSHQDYVQSRLYAGIWN